MIDSPGACSCLLMSVWEYNEKRRTGLVVGVNKKIEREGGAVHCFSFRGEERYTKPYEKCRPKDRALATPQPISSNDPTMIK